MMQSDLELRIRAWLQPYLLDGTEAFEKIVLMLHSRRGRRICGEHSRPSCATPTRTRCASTSSSTCRRGQSKPRLRRNLEFPRKRGPAGGLSANSGDENE